MATIKRQLAQQETKCVECGVTLKNDEAIRNHFHAVHSLPSGDFIITVPDNTEIGSWDAAVTLTKSCEELRNKHPDTEFSFIPFAYAHPQQNTQISGLYAMLAVAKKSR